MRMTSVLGTSAFLLLVFCVGLPGTAYGYLDAGTGSYVIQLIIAGFLGFLFALRIFWRRIRLFIGRLFLRRAKDDEPER